MTAEQLGGAKVHTTKSAVADGAYDNDVICIEEMRRLMDFLPLSNRDKVPHWPTSDDPHRQDMSLDTLVPENANKPYDMKELILKVADEGDFFEIGEAFAKNIVTGFGRIEGSTVGFVANQPMVLAGVLDNDASRKARAVRALLRLLQYSHRDVRGCARLFCPAWRRSMTASSNTARSCCSPMPKRRRRRSPSSRARPMAAPMT